MQRVPITRAGYQRLKQELERLQREERPRVIQAIEEARAHGDISENAEYEAAKEKQGMIEGRINDLNGKLASSEIFDGVTNNGGRAIFGCTVVIEDLDSGEESTFQLVGPYEADIKTGTLSVTSPLGRALIGKEEGDEVEFKAPGGRRSLELLEIRSSGD